MKELRPRLDWVALPRRRHAWRGDKLLISVYSTDYSPTLVGYQVKIDEIHEVGPCTHWKHLSLAADY